MTTKIILWASVIWLVPVMYFLLKNEAKFKKNIAVGVTFPFAGRQDADVLAALVSGFTGQGGLGLKWEKIGHFPILLQNLSGCYIINYYR